MGLRRNTPMNTQKTPSTAVTVNQILDRCEQECLDAVRRWFSIKANFLREVERE
jgi:hypothetical protein